MMRSTARSDTAVGMYNRFPLPSAVAMGQNTHGRSLKTTGVVCHFVGYALPIQSPSITGVSRGDWSRSAIDSPTVGKFILELAPSIMPCSPLPPPISRAIMAVACLSHILYSPR